MKKTIVTLVALCAAMSADATVLRVSNISGSTAPYATIQDAMGAAAEGDTIMLDASAKAYEGILYATYGLTPIPKREQDFLSREFFEPNVLSITLVPIAQELFFMGNTIPKAPSTPDIIDNFSPPVIVSNE